jgi:hypothetical protein
MEQQAADRPAVVITGTVAERRLASLFAVLAPSPAKAITIAEAARKWAGRALRLLQ